MVVDPGEKDGQGHGMEMGADATQLDASVPRGGAGHVWDEGMLGGETECYGVDWTPSKGKEARCGEGRTGRCLRGKR